LYARTELIPQNNGKICFQAKDLQIFEEFDAQLSLPINGLLNLQKGVYNRIVKQFVKKPLSFIMNTSMDVPTRSGLGTSSTVVVSIIGAFKEWLDLPLTNYEIAKLAFEIEREDLQMAGGKQDQYAAVFGGLNYIEFHRDNAVLVSPLLLKADTQKLLENHLLLFYTKTSRESAGIIKMQANNVATNQTKPIQAMHFLKQQAIKMKAALENEDLVEVGHILDRSWHHKKEMANGITTAKIDEIYTLACKAGALGGKISGAGGGGFMIFYVPPEKKQAVIESLHNATGEIREFQFCNKGLTTSKNG
jgi:D-glycero-alpha-D-manno-heptose-7-phosphate kinase